MSFGNNDWGANQLYAESFQASDSFTASTMELMITQAATGHFKMAIYSDSNGKPGSLLGQSVEGSNLGTGWQSLALTSPVQLSAGQTYWLAWWTDDNNYRWAFDQSGGTLMDMATPYGNWPNLPQIQSTMVYEASIYACSSN